jgi:hypothetical protein
LSDEGAKTQSRLAIQFRQKLTYSIADTLAVVASAPPKASGYLPAG